MRRFLLQGSAEAVALAVDRLHVFCEVHAVVEWDGRCEVCLDGSLPDLVGVQWQELEIPDPDSPVTGRENDRPVLVSSQLLVRPPWVSTPADFQGIELVVPRGIAFGSGEHGSTRAALRMMERMWTGSIRSAADVGTGSGILALFATRLGCPRIGACDVDEDAVRVARELVPGATVVVGGPAELSSRFGTCGAVVANLRGAEIEGCRGELLALWDRSGPLILSGLRPEEVPGHIEGVGQDPTARIDEGGYVALGFAPTV